MPSQDWGPNVVGSEEINRGISHLQELTIYISKKGMLSPMVQKGNWETDLPMTTQTMRSKELDTDYLGPRPVPVPKAIYPNQ